MLVLEITIYVCISGKTKCYSFREATSNFAVGELERGRKWCYALCSAKIPPSPAS